VSLENYQVRWTSSCLSLSPSLPVSLSWARCHQSCTLWLGSQSGPTTSLLVHNANLSNIQGALPVSSSLTMLILFRQLSSASWPLSSTDSYWSNSTVHGTKIMRLCFISLSTVAHSHFSVLYFSCLQFKTWYRQYVLESFILYSVTLLKQLLYRNLGSS
jgi:hypothetical protein